MPAAWASSKARTAMASAASGSPAILPRLARWYAADQRMKGRRSSSANLAAASACRCAAVRSPIRTAVTPLQGRLQRRRPLGVRLAGNAEAAVVGQSGHSQASGVSTLLGEAGGVEQRVPVRGVAGPALGFPEGDEQVATLLLVGEACAREQ